MRRARRLPRGDGKPVPIDKLRLHHLKTGQELARIRQLREELRLALADPSDKRALAQRKLASLRRVDVNNFISRLFEHYKAHHEDDPPRLKYMGRVGASA